MIPPGWYPDKTDPALVRWWDGQAWTPHTRANVAAAPPSPTPETAVAGFPPPAIPPPLPARAAGTDVDARVREAEERLRVLRGELESVEEALEIQSFGFYRPRYGFGTASEYTFRLADVRDRQKRAIKNGEATHCEAEWTIDGSRAEGRKMIQRLSKLMLRAFNGECDAAITKARYDNVVTLEERLTKSCREISKLGETNRVFITRFYFELKIEELHLVHEHREKVQEEKEEQKRIREELREQDRAREEIERVQEQAEKDEVRAQRALAKAREDLSAGVATAKQHEKLEALIVRLENELKDALDRKAKAIARAQITKSGHVYVLSNVGSFGEGIYKIGLTRRLDPYERVDELGDASVPFAFDVHAIIFAEDAPALENALHKAFADRRVNRVNMRKEYFRVSLQEIQAALQEHHGLVSMVLDAEAEEYRKTVAMLEASAS